MKCVNNPIFHRKMSAVVNLLGRFMLELQVDQCASYCRTWRAMGSDVVLLPLVASVTAPPVDGEWLVNEKYTNTTSITRTTNKNNNDDRFTHVKHVYRAYFIHPLHLNPDRIVRKIIKNKYSQKDSRPLSLCLMTSKDFKGSTYSGNNILPGTMLGEIK